MYVCTFFIISHSELYLLRFVSGKLNEYVMLRQEHNQNMHAPLPYDVKVKLIHNDNKIFFK